MNTRNRTPSEYVLWVVFVFFRIVFKKGFRDVVIFIQRNHVSIWNWIQKFHPKKRSSKSNRVSRYIIDETLIQVGSELIWLWVAIEPENKQILALPLPKISKERKHVCSRKVSIKPHQYLWKTLFQQMMEELGIHKPADS